MAERLQTGRDGVSVGSLWQKGIGVRYDPSILPELEEPCAPQVDNWGKAARVTPSATWTAFSRGLGVKQGWETLGSSPVSSFALGDSSALQLKGKEEECGVWQVEDLVRQVTEVEVCPPHPFWGGAELQAWTPHPAFPIGVCICLWGVSGLSTPGCGRGVWRPWKDLETGGGD